MAFESVLVGSGELFVAPVGEAFPDVDTTPAGNWESLGDVDGGVTVNLNQTLDEHRVDDESGPIKATISEEDLQIVANLAEATLENLGNAFDRQDPVTAAGPPAIKTNTLYRGVGVVTEMALLFRTSSPYVLGTASNMQFEVPRAVQAGNIGPAFVKDGKTLIPVEFHALADQSAPTAAEKFGRLIAQTA
ncbi:hypothetical protein LCGC14_0577590 [marine sediment metagenome]|uniref:Uncharacterized protein n=1 Tax=marine sediment metagenome TaxID=412755 RepID=A0A0F9U3Q7_9ZZZZ